MLYESTQTLLVYIHLNLGGLYGFLLEPINFNLYIVDMKKILDDSKCIQYAVYILIDKLGKSVIDTKNN